MSDRHHVPPCEKEDFTHLAELSAEMRQYLDEQVIAVFRDNDICPSCMTYLLRNLADRAADGWKHMTGGDGCYKPEH